MTTPLTQQLDPDAPDYKNPAIPVTVNQLAPRPDAIEIIEKRVRVIETLRRASIRTTNPEDWVLFKGRDEDGGAITGYLEDKGAQRVRDFWGIEIYNVQDPPTKITGATPEDFHYRQIGDGVCKLTGQIVEKIVGSRSSLEDFCKGKTGTELEVDVEKATRANLNGSITRELAGLGAVPIQELAAAWEGTSKTVDRCHKGRGFGSFQSRMGAPEQVEDEGLVPPKCHLCQKPMRLIKGSKGRFYSCVDYKTHGKDARGVDFDKWKQNPASRPTETPGQKSPTAVPPTSEAGGPPRAEKVAPLSADEVFGNNHPHEREPGEEG